MALSTKVLVGVAGGLGALALIGAGAGASFTDSASANGSISTGTVGVGLSTTNGNFQHTLNLGAATNQGSSFDLKTPLYFGNTGSLDIKKLTIKVSAGGADNDPNHSLATGIEIYVNGSDAGTLAAAEAGTPITVNYTIPAGKSVGGSVELKATNLDNNAEGHTVNPVLTVTGSDA